MAVHAFSSIVSSLRLPSTASVGVAVSGGRDSITLVYLAKQIFKRVVGITVDHQ
jgi:tRNA(Ile)-lysidine synthase TilS/MesJ